jgi:hypothetical protein
MSDEAPREASSSGAHRYSRSLADKILIVFHYACDQADFEIAGQLLQVVELMLKHPHTADTHRRSRDSLVAAHERLWHLKHPGAVTSAGQAAGLLAVTPDRRRATAWCAASGSWRR